MNWYKKAWIKDKTIQTLNNYNFEIIEHVAIEGYDLALTKGPNYFGEFNSSPYIYQIAIQHEDSDFTDIEQQKEKRKMMNFPNVFKLSGEIKSTLERWLAEYQRLYIGSMNQEKNNKYMNILKWFGFNIKKVPTEYDYMNSGAMYIE